MVPASATAVANIVLLPVASTTLLDLTVRDVGQLGWSGAVKLVVTLLVVVTVVAGGWLWRLVTKYGVSVTVDAWCNGWVRDCGIQTDEDIQGLEDASIWVTLTGECYHVNAMCQHVRDKRLDPKQRCLHCCRSVVLKQN